MDLGIEWASFFIGVVVAGGACVIAFMIIMLLSFYGRH